MDSDCSAEAAAVRDLMVRSACEAGWHLRCGTDFIPHIQFRRQENERPYPYALNINRDVPTVYVRRPSAEQRLSLVAAYAGAHLNIDGEVKMPVPDTGTARRILAEILLLPAA